NFPTSHARGNFSSPELNLAGTTLEQIRGRIQADRGVAQVAEFDASFPGSTENPPGKISVKSQADVRADKPAAIQIAIDNAPLALVGNFVKLDPVPTGTASANIEANAPLSQLTRPEAWQATGQVTAGPARWNDRTVDQVTAD